MGEEVVREQHGLGVLEVGPTRHRDPEVARRLRDEGVDHVEDQPGDDPGVLPEVHPEERRDLVVAGAPGPQPPADVGAGPVDEAALERRVDVLVVLGRAERAGLDVGPEPVEGVEHRGEVSSSSRPAPWSTRAWARDPAMSCRASRQSKWVDLDRAASASAGPPANRPPHSAALVGLSVGSVTGGPSGCRT